MDRISARNRYRLGWVGALCLLLIIPIKLLRVYAGADTTLIIGVVPSILGPPGLLLLLLSSTGRLSRLTPLQLTIMVGVVAGGLELFQLLPRPGILALLLYTFDYLDLVASLLSLVVTYFVLTRIGQRSEPS